MPPAPCWASASRMRSPANSPVVLGTSESEGALTPRHGVVPDRLQDLALASASTLLLHGLGTRSSSNATWNWPSKHSFEHACAQPFTLTVVRVNGLAEGRSASRFLNNPGSSAQRRWTTAMQRCRTPPRRSEALRSRSATEAKRFRHGGLARCPRTLPKMEIRPPPLQ
jgi:hypothetical protein